jgi:hypothetical protein
VVRCKEKSTNPIHQLPLFLLQSNHSSKDPHFPYTIHCLYTCNREARRNTLKNNQSKLFIFSSPHLVDVRERIRIDGQPLSKEKFVSYFWEIYNKLEDTKVRTK